MNLTLLNTMFKKNRTLLIIFFGVLTMYMTVMISMYDPNEMEALESMIKLLPEDMAKAMGFATLVPELTGYLASWLYGLLMFGFPMVYCIILGNRLVARMVDNGSFAYLLSTPNSRSRIIVTQGVYALASVALLFAALFAVGVAASEAMVPGALNVGAFLRLNITTMLVNMTVMMITFFFSCLFSESKSAVSFGAGIPITFLLMNMLGGASQDAGILKRLSIYGIYDPVELVQNGRMWGINLFYIAVIAVLFVASVLIFRQKRLAL
jgi:ABC-2 type transport system permease protein